MTIDTHNVKIALSIIEDTNTIQELQNLYEDENMSGNGRKTVNNAITQKIGEITMNNLSNTNNEDDMIEDDVTEEYHKEERERLDNGDTISLKQRMLFKLGLDHIVAERDYEELNAKYVGGTVEVWINREYYQRNRGNMYELLKLVHAKATERNFEAWFNKNGYLAIANKKD